MYDIYIYTYMSYPASLGMSKFDSKFAHYYTYSFAVYKQGHFCVLSTVNQPIANQLHSSV